MIVAVARVTLYMPDNESLKDKRRVLKSLTERMRRRFNVAVAEVDEIDVWRRAVLGLCCVSNNFSHAEQMIRSVIDWIDDETAGQMTDYEIEFW